MTQPDMSSSLSCSIIINTFNRASYLRKLLPGLARLKGVAFEVIIVNGPSTDETMEVLHAYLDVVKLIQCPEANLSVSRNLGIQAAAGDIVVFIDDDAIPADENWLKSFMDAYLQDTAGKIGALGGPVIVYDTDHYESRNGYISDYGDTKFDLELSETSQLDPTRWFRYAPGGNGAYRRRALIEVGGFDEFYGYYLDESDTCTRLARSGYVVDGVPAAAIRHYPARQKHSFGQLIPRWRTITRSDTYYALKNGGDRLLVRALKTIQRATGKHFFGEIFTRPSTNRQKLSLLMYWLQGFVEGYWKGLTQPRRLGNFQASPPPFLPFEPKQISKPLRIAFVCQKIPGQTGYGGIGRYVYDAALGLFERGHEVHVFCKDQQPLRREGLGFFVHGIPPGPVNESAFDPNKPILSKNISHSLAVLHRLEELHAEGLVFDVIHAANWDAEIVALIRANVYPITLMLVTPLAKTIASEEWQLNEDLQACLDVDRWQIEHAHTLCVPSEGVKSIYRTTVGVDNSVLSRARLVGLGIIPRATRLAARNDAGRCKRLLFVGRLERRKGVPVLLSVLEHVLETRTDWECHLVGDEGEKLADGMTLRQRFMNDNRNKPWLSRVVFHGLVSDDELLKHYRECDLFVAPSLFESFGLIYQEAMQYGKPVIGSRTGGVPEVVTDTIDGLLVKPGDAADLRHALETLMDDPETRVRLGAAGRAKIADVANYRRMAAALETVFQESVEAHKDQTALDRGQLWPTALGLFGDDPAIELTGDWTRHTYDGRMYLVGQPGSIMRISLPAQFSVRCRTLRHEWSGALEVRTYTGRQVVDLFVEAGRTDRLHEFVLDGPDSAYGPQRMTIQVLDERNPLSQGNEVWIASLALIRSIPTPAPKH